MQSHQLTKYSSNAPYNLLDIVDLLLAATIEKHLDIDDKQPVHLGLSNLFNSSYEKKIGFDNIEVLDNPGSKISLYPTQIHDGKTQHITAEIFGLEGLFNNRVVIFPNLMLDEKDIRMQYLDHQYLKNSRLIIAPIHSYGHSTVFILDHKNRKGYYFDSLKKNNKFFEQYCSNLGYEYSCNEKKIQFDGVSCGAIIVEFIFHVINCIKNKQEISADDMPEFRPGREAYIEMRERHKALLSFTPTFIVGMAQKYIFNYFREEKPVVIENSINSHNSYIPIMTSLGILIGGVSGVGISRIKSLNQPGTTFLSNKLQISIEGADIMFSVSCAVICASILGIVGYIVGNYALENV